ncbi:MAG: pyrroline-5-carboxylate reductase [Chloroflexota bacterium]|nr:pyrroline-5-carboxylate reductase [Dehalococcoidia bacterium]MDW8252571.1 pyrroline-5-carboxylate reductase [Chloroflexota bacterium]
MRVTIVGGGTMGEAILARLIANAWPGELCVIEIAPSRRAELAARYSVPILAAPPADLGDLIVLAVKPQDASAAYASLGPPRPGQAVLSIMAGVRMAAIREGTGRTAIIRAMPNTPAAIGEGYTVWTATPEVPAETRRQAQALLAQLGRERYVDDEKYLDMATAVNGSGPAFVYLFIEALSDAAVALGLPRPMAHELVTQTVRGAAAYLQASGAHPAILRNDVTSPAGTTAAGLYQLERHAVRAAIQEAVVAAYRRSQELGNA